VHSLKALDPQRPIREATELLHYGNRRFGPLGEIEARACFAEKKTPQEIAGLFFFYF